MTCNDAQPLIARYADDEAALPVSVREDVDRHVVGCSACRAALEEQRAVAGLLRGRLESTPRPGFVARVSARIDAGSLDARKPGSAKATESEGWLGLANWRAWTVGLAPLAAALIVAAYIDMRGPASTVTTPTVAASFEELTTGSAPAALQPAATGDALIEAVLTGVAPASGDPDVR